MCWALLVQWLCGSVRSAASMTQGGDGDQGRSLAQGSSRGLKTWGLGWAASTAPTAGRAWWPHRGGAGQAHPEDSQLDGGWSVQPRSPNHMGFLRTNPARESEAPNSGPLGDHPTLPLHQLPAPDHSCLSPLTAWGPHLLAEVWDSDSLREASQEEGGVAPGQGLCRRLPGRTSRPQQVCFMSTQDRTTGSPPRPPLVGPQVRCRAAAQSHVTSPQAPAQLTGSTPQVSLSPLP